MADPSQSNQNSEVKINNFQTLITDIEAIDHNPRSIFQRGQITKSKNNIKLNPIAVQPTYLPPQINQQPMNFNPTPPLGNPTQPQINIPPPNHYSSPPPNHYSSPPPMPVQPQHLSQINQMKQTTSSLNDQIKTPQLRKENSGSSFTSPTRRGKTVKKGYQIAEFNKTLDYLHSQSYRKKVINAQDGDEQYQPIEVCGSNEELKQFGLGIYLYFQFMRRLAITLFIMSVILIFPLMTNFKGTGLEKYTQSFTITLARFSLGNISNGDSQTYLIITISDILTMLVLFFFYLHWRSFHKSTIEEMEKDHTIVNPNSYAVSVDNFFDELSSPKSLEAELKNYIDAIYNGAYQIEIVQNYKGNFKKFIEYDQQIEELEIETQIIKQTGKDTTKMRQIEERLNKTEQELEHISQAFEPLYAIIHFSTLKAKLAFINHCKRYKLQSGFSQSFQRSLCCTPMPPQKYLFQKQFPIFIRNNKLSRPEQINWSNIDLTNFSIFIRWVLSFVFVIISILITSALIGFCTLYVASTSSCLNYSYVSTGVSATDVGAVQLLGETARYCYCNEHLTAMYSDTIINTFCSSISSKILMTNALQIAASILSSITNVILGILITVIAKYLLRPNSIPKQYGFIFWGVLISNFINSCIIPLVLNANIFGVQFVSYLKFIDFMDFSNISIFGDFNRDWYALISPYYINMMIIAAFISPFIGLVIFAIKNSFNIWRIKSACQNKDKQDPLIQKQANKRIASNTFSFAQQHSTIMLFLFITIMYSGLIPLLIPVFGIGVFFWYLCKRAIVVKYSIKIPADESLSESFISIIPFIILAHALFSVWSHTSPGIFAADAPLINFNWSIFSGALDRIFSDIIITGQAAFIIGFLAFNYTIVNFIGSISECCKDQLEMPVQFAAIENQKFSDRLKKANILGSYKLINSPTYGHALKAYNELIFRQKQGMEDTKDEFNPERFD